MECQSLLIYAHLQTGAVDPDDVRLGQLVTLAVGLSLLLVTRLVMLLLAAL
ncbi:hypothetical protein M2222_005091 [Bradyrhizobium elkanii]|nr:hypothetical protein [Bradyrhizobium elkanii]MCS3562769.1 hypothetical protein [Bradyrhizobium elkanii]MCW2147395.1 hypothetical protein [Bradyrhizobium elkanii]MCW2353523.1 hypothetical protein [Bradyrhizobium elkanii]MCW2371121.1 hypothetical protein [Bradyrhizobium elkanii]